MTNTKSIPRQKLKNGCFLISLVFRKLTMVDNNDRATRNTLAHAYFIPKYPTNPEISHKRF